MRSTEIHPNVANSLMGKVLACVTRFGAITVMSPALQPNSAAKGCETCSVSRTGYVVGLAAK